jgi:hypothetical protein
MATIAASMARTGGGSQCGGGELEKAEVTVEHGAHDTIAASILAPSKRLERARRRRRVWGHGTRGGADGDGDLRACGR